MNDTARAMQALRPILAPFAAAYAGVMWARRRLYRAGLLASWSPPGVCVSVGNIGWGGSGKTPLAGWLLGWAGRKGIGTVLLTRGYGARAAAYPHEVTAQSLAEEAGDEPLLLARDNPQARVVVDPVRSRGGLYAAERHRPELYVLDDGFQHLAVRRDMDLVLLRAEDLGAEWEAVHPAGSWREGKSALAAADAFLMKAGPQTFQRLQPLLTKRLGRYERPVFSFFLAAVGVRNLASLQFLPDFGQAPYLLVSGVGNPGQVQRTAEGLLKSRAARHVRFSDHHLFTKADVESLKRVAAGLGCQSILCTAKDAVKLGPMADETFHVLETELRFGPSLFSSARFDEWWDRRWNILTIRRDERLSRDAGKAPQPAAEAHDQEDETA